MTPKSLVSIIVPVFNTGKYLPQCVHSILCQTYSFLELILIDDGSSDESPFLCDQIANSDSRVKVIHKPNGGLSETRNVGLSFAKGKYIIFLDSDDFWMSNDSLQILVSQMEMEEIDFLCFNCSYFYPSVNRYIPWKAYDDELLRGRDKEQAIINLVRSGTFPMSACLKIINRSFLLKNRIFFEEGIFSEDIPWFLELICKANSFGFINQYIYAYRKEVNTSITSNFSEKKYNDLWKILKVELDKILKYPWKPDVKDALLSFLAYEYCILLGLSSLFSFGARRAKLNELKEYVWLLKYRLNPKVFKVYILRETLGLNITSYFLKFYLVYCLGVKKRHNV